MDVFELNNKVSKLIDAEGIVPVVVAVTEYASLKADEEEKLQMVGKQWRNLHDKLKSIWR